MGQGYFVSGDQRRPPQRFDICVNTPKKQQAMLIAQSIAFQIEDTANENPGVGATGGLIDQSLSQYEVRANKRPGIPPFISLGEIT